MNVHRCGEHKTMQMQFHSILY